MVRFLFTGTLATILLVAALPITLSAQDESRPRGPLANRLRVTGRVLDHETGDPIANADVLLGDSLHQTTNERGRFEFPLVHPGAYTLEVQRLGYQVVEDSLRVPNGMNFRIDVRMVPRAVELEPVVVKVRASMGKMAGFYHRRRLGRGSYVTREDIQDRNPGFVTDMLRQIRGVRLVPRRGASFSGYDVLMRGNCRPQLWIDGTRVSAGGLGIDEMLGPLDIEGIEVYRGAETPVRYDRSACGAILVWTRVPQRDGTASLTKILIATGVVGALAFILTR